MTAHFQQFQRDFGAYLRHPRGNHRPASLPARPAGVYRELVFNNVCGFLDSCFPLCRSLLGEMRWRRLNRAFVADWPLHTPWFREIPAEFARYLREGRIHQPLPRWFAQLAHYEWAELAVDTMACAEPEPLAAGALLDTPAVLNPALMLLANDWPVQRIGPDYRPRKPVTTCLAVFRDAGQQVRFSELSAMSLRLLALLQQADITPRRAIAQLAKELAHPAPDTFLAQAHALLIELQAQGIVRGETP